MKLKIKIKIDVVKHYKEKESEVAKKILDNVKTYSIKVKTTNEGLSENSSVFQTYKVKFFKIFF